ncbi:hypothetical protein [Algirhabdus cladophorae]|uniref:hypothetical protein n=1 Tax=Algirhabdus cladophorae TaxID=3377108 RepID=UPI003B84658D
MHFGIILAALLLPFTGLPTFASPLNDWEVSCKVDRGSVQKKRRNWYFQTSKNYCVGGVFKQRAELYSDPIKPTHKGSYLFQTQFQIDTNSSQEFSVFSIHDARDGCAPPFQLFITPRGGMYVSSDIKLGPGEQCDRGTFGQRANSGIKRDGTPYDLKILVSFDGKGAFDGTVWLNDVVQIQDRYEPPNRPDAIISKKFYFKHGVYSRNVFPYKAVSSKMRVKRVRLKTQ